MNNIERKVHRLDATDQPVGRLSTQIAILLRGKNKTDFAPHMDMGDVVEVANAAKVKFTGKKKEQKEYFHFSGYIGGLKTKKMSDVFEKDPAEVIRRAVKQMLPPVRFRENMLKRLIIR